MDNSIYYLENKRKERDRPVIKFTFSLKRFGAHLMPITKKFNLKLSNLKLIFKSLSCYISVTAEFNARRHFTIEIRSNDGNQI